jgi:N-formylglutamate amidohydrolase
MYCTVRPTDNFKEFRGGWLTKAYSSSPNVPWHIVTCELDRLYAMPDIASSVLLGAGLSQYNWKGMMGASILRQHFKRRYIVWAQHGNGGEAAVI